jgi:hypothetical protein
VTPIAARTPSRCERESALMAARLADPALLSRAVEIKLGKDDSADTCLAVPLGGERVAGEVTVMGWSQALLVLLALDGKPGFPDLRDGTSCTSAIDALRTIRWGLHTGFQEPQQRARMWGYHEAGVQAYVAEQTRLDPRIPVTPLPDLPTAPTAARIYDVLLGDRENYLADRRYVQSLGRDDAEALSTAAVINRTHLPAVVDVLAARGVDQYLDLGCGLPAFVSPPNVSKLYRALHDIVAQRQDRARVVYADHDKHAFGITRIELEEHPMRPEWVLGDIRHMRQFLDSGRVQYLLDWSRPIGVLLHDVLPWIDSDETVATALAVLREQLPPGSALSLTHAADLGENRMTRFTAEFREAGLAFKPRDAAALGALFGDWPLEPPGLVPTHRWHPDHPHTGLDPQAAGALAGLAFKPGLTS